MGDFFYHIYQSIQSKKIIGIAVFLTIISLLGWLASRISFEEDITKLIPTTKENSDAQRVLKTVNFADKIIVNIKREGQGSVDDLTEYASQFIDSLSKNSNNYYTKIQGKVEDETVLNTLDFVYNNLPLFLEAQDYAEIENKLHKDSIDNITRNNYKTLISPSGFVTKETILKDPLGLSVMALKKLQQLTFGNSFSLHNGFLLSQDKKHILLFITPTHKSSETAENTLFSEQLYLLQDQLNSEFNGTVSSEYFGGALIAVANAKQIKGDIQLTVSIAMSILLLILIVFYRKITLPLILFIPTVFGGLLAVALLFIIRTKISAISLGIGSVLLGVTLDYSLHVLTHIRNNNDTKALYEEITKPILMSSLTTALAFLCLLFLNSQALQDLGIFAAISVLGASSFALVFIPQVYKSNGNLSNKKTLIDKIAHIDLHKKQWLIITVVIFFCISFFTYNKVGFNNDLSKLNYEPPEMMEAQKRLDALTNIASKSVYLAAYSESEQEAIQINDSIYTKLTALKSHHDIVDFSSIGAIIQSETEQAKHLKVWNDFWTDQRKESLQKNLIESGHILGFKPSTFHTFYEHLDSEFSPLSVSDFSALDVINIDDYINTENNFTTVTSLVKLQNEKTEDLVNSFKETNQTLVIDRKQMNETFLGNLKNDFNSLVGYSLIVVLLILFLFYRSLSLTLVTSIPIALTWLLTIGIMGLVGIEFNIFNIIISTFIFGLGIDYSIFITNGLLKAYQTGEQVIATNKTSIILSVITTILGVGVLIFAKHPALYTISLVSIIGILSAMLMAFTIQPLLFKLFIGSKSKRPISLRLLIHSCLSFGYYGIGGFVLSMLSLILIPLIPISKKVKMAWFHKTISVFMKSVLYSNPFVSKKIINTHNETFEKQCIIIANHTSFLDILAMGMLHPKIIFLVNDWVYKSPIFGKAVQLAGFYPVSSGIENGLEHLKKKVEQGYSLMAFPEGTRSNTNKIRRFHKGAFFLAEQLNLDIVPVLIHGNSEVLPKGSFIIKDGSITLKILERISTSDTRYGTTYKERTKQISQYFRSEFNSLREKIENDTYFHPIVLEDFRYKGDQLYKHVKRDLKEHASEYKFLMDTIDEQANIVHLSKDCGQLDFLLSLDSPDRKITTYIEDSLVREIVANSYISNTHYKITVAQTKAELSSNIGDTLILNTSENIENLFDSLLTDTFENIILLHESQRYYLNVLESKSFNIISKNTNYTILKNKH
ncbi:glycerol acyltransferase [Hanstruepera neustonica]|uniref:Glycerol acyltransferase n=1 Tax=Hanstruepera neustonica TaxID=1445657 RepID=A0A2K1E304_9FLAO|nr:1-acyl-sn-glycerol-3-phosphate acyltransferase [Hanstruepera neustonica]PNQ74659.1 glycerol acyltransferase [Hanstruepera neustonica]